MGCEISNSSYPLNIKTQGIPKEETLILNVIRGKEIDIEYNKKNIIEKELTDKKMELIGHIAKSNTI